MIKRKVYKPLFVNKKGYKRLCQICEKRFKECDIYVKYHNRINRKYRGAASQKCILNLTLTKTRFITFHKLQYYNSHFIFQEVSKKN